MQSDLHTLLKLQRPIPSEGYYDIGRDIFVEKEFENYIEGLEYHATLINIANHKNTQLLLKELNLIDSNITDLNKVSLKILDSNIAIDKSLYNLFSSTERTNELLINTSKILSEISENIKIPDSEKERLKEFYLGLNFFSKASKNKELFLDSLKHFLNSYNLGEYDFLVNYYIGEIYLFHLNDFDKANIHLTKSLKYLIIDDVFLGKEETKIGYNLQTHNFNNTTIKLFTSVLYDNIALNYYLMNDDLNSIKHQEESLIYESNLERKYLLAKYNSVSNNNKNSIKLINNILEEKPEYFEFFISDLDFLLNDNVAKALLQKLENVHSKMYDILAKFPDNIDLTIPENWKIGKYSEHLNRLEEIKINYELIIDSMNIYDEYKLNSKLYSNTKFNYRREDRLETLKGYLITGNYSQIELNYNKLSEGNKELERRNKEYDKLENLLNEIKKEPKNPIYESIIEKVCELLIKRDFDSNINSKNVEFANYFSKLKKCLKILEILLVKLKPNDAIKKNHEIIVNSTEVSENEIDTLINKYEKKANILIRLEPILSNNINSSFLKNEFNELKTKYDSIVYGKLENEDELEIEIPNMIFNYERRLLILKSDNYKEESEKLVKKLERFLTENANNLKTKDYEEINNLYHDINSGHITSENIIDLLEGGIDKIIRNYKQNIRIINKLDEFLLKYNVSNKLNEEFNVLKTKYNNIISGHLEIESEIDLLMFNYKLKLNQSQNNKTKKIEIKGNDKNKNNPNQEDIKKWGLLGLHFLAPLIIAPILMEIKLDGETSFQVALFFGLLFTSGIIIAFNTAGFDVKSKTGRSFETKSGLVLDEYETTRVDTSIRSNKNHKRILLIHVLIIVIMIYIKLKEPIGALVTSFLNIFS